MKEENGYKIYTKKELAQILEEHAMFLRGEGKNKRADLRSAVLSCSLPLPLLSAVSGAKVAELKKLLNAAAKAVSKLSEIIGHCKGFQTP